MIIIREKDKSEYLSTKVHVSVYCPFSEHLSTCGNWCPHWDKYFNGSHWIVKLHCTKNEIKIDGFVVHDSEL